MMQPPAAKESDTLMEAYYQLSMAQPSPTAETLEAVIRDYPQYADALTAFAIELALDALANGDEEELDAEASDSINEARRDSG